MDKIKFAPPYIDEEIISAVVDVLRSGWITSGPICLELEKELSTFMGTKDVVCCSSWTSGAILTLTALGVGNNDEVIIPNYTYAATALAVMHAGAKPKIVDVDENLQMDLVAIKKAVSSKTKAIMPVDVGGLPCNIDKIRDLLIELDRKDITIILDAAHSFGATIDGHKVGNQADVTIFSMHAVKNLTSAEGGFITTSSSFYSDSFYKELRLLRLNGQTKDAFSKTLNKASWEYDIVRIGYKMNLPDVLAVIALKQLKSYELQLLRRHDIFKRYEDGLNSLEIGKSLPRVIGNQVSSCHLFIFILHEEYKHYRNIFIEEMAEKDIPLNVHFKPLSLLSVFQDSNFDMPNSINLYQRAISFPIHMELTNKQVDYVIKNFVALALNKISR
jgi:dTDP-4-amino-4,6-dideoxygalactose transaminase